MDRFIAISELYSAQPYQHLKSNMDRFIGVSKKADKESTLAFKIQYG